MVVAVVVLGGALALLIGLVVIATRRFPGHRVKIVVCSICVVLVALIVLPRIMGIRVYSTEVEPPEGVLNDQVGAVLNEVFSQANLARLLESAQLEERLTAGDVESMLSIREPQGPTDLYGWSLRTGTTWKRKVDATGALIPYIGRDIELRLSGVKKRAEAPSGFEIQSGFEVDGEAKDWSGIEPFVQEAGIDGRSNEHYLDVKEVVLSNDSNYLYVFLRCDPSIEEWFSIIGTSRGICDLLFDTDNRSDTGCDFTFGFNDRLAKGYEIKTWIMLELHTDIGTSTESYTVSYELFRPEQDGTFALNRVRGTHQSSHRFGSLILDGTDGVEMAIPLKKLGVKANQTVRVLLIEVSNLAGLQEGSSAGTYTFR